jgi:hypothetical protein
MMIAIVINGHQEVREDDCHLESGYVGPPPPSLL